MIVEAQHAVNAATACSRLAKATQSSAKSAESDDLRVQAFFKTVSRMGTSMDAQPVASTLECTGRSYARVEHNLGTESLGGQDRTR